MRNKTLVIGAFAAVSLSLTGCAQNLVQNDPITCTVVDKDRSTEVVDGQSKSVFRIYTEGCGEDNATLGMADNLFGGGFNTSDRYGKIQVGKTYEFETVGVRNGFLSLFKEIVKATEVPAP